jgi:predicted transcriptional regulator of viral defense system
MSIDYNNEVAKTLGPRAAQLITGLYDKNKPTFTVQDAAAITNLSAVAVRKLIHSLVEKGIVTRLKAGLYNIVPFEHGTSRTYFGNPYEVAANIVKKASEATSKDPKYFISHGSAMDIHQMVTQPQLTVFASSTKRIRKQNLMGTDFHFVFIKKEQFFGTEEHWISKTEKVTVSDLERTIIDGLKMPGYCGGIVEVAKGLWIKRKSIDTEKLSSYAKKMNVGAVYRRLGFLLETFEMANKAALQKLLDEITNGYHLLDPELGKEGKHISKWRLRLNVTKEELKAVIRT